MKSGRTRVELTEIRIFLFAEGPAATKTKVDLWLRGIAVSMLQRFKSVRLVLERHEAIVVTEKERPNQNWNSLRGRKYLLTLCRGNELISPQSDQRPRTVFGCWLESCPRRSCQRRGLYVRQLVSETRGRPGSCFGRYLTASIFSRSSAFFVDSYET